MELYLRHIVWKGGSFRIYVNVGTSNDFSTQSIKNVYNYLDLLNDDNCENYL